MFWWDVPEPGTVPAAPFGNGGQLLAGLPGMQLLDSLAVDGEGWVCVATLVNGGITSISPDGVDRGTHADWRSDHHQHLFRRRGPAHRVHHAVGVRSSRLDAVAPSRV